MLGRGSVCVAIVCLAQVTTSCNSSDSNGGPTEDVAADQAAPDADDVTAEDPGGADQDASGAPDEAGVADDGGGGDADEDTLAEPDEIGTTDLAPGDADTVATPEGLIGVDALSFVGAFRFSSAEFGDSSLDYAIGTLAYNPANHSLFIAGHDYHGAVAEFAIPEIVAADEVAALAVVEAPIQEFVSLLDASPSGNPEGIDRITGILLVDGQLIVNAEQWYDAPADNVDTTLIVRDAADLSGAAIDGYFELAGGARAAGYMGRLPVAWQQALGGDCLTGWSSVYSIIGRYSVGPSLFAFDSSLLLNAPAGGAGPIATTEHMSFAHGGGHYLDPAALETQEGSASALWNFLSRGLFGFVVPGTRTYAVLGSSGGVDSGIGYKIIQDNGHECGGYCAYQADDYDNYYWLFDLQTILDASEVWDAQPYAYGELAIPFDGGGAHGIIGGAFDAAGSVLYLALQGAGQVGEWDYPPLIVAYSVAVD